MTKTKTKTKATPKATPKTTLTPMAQESTKALDLLQAENAALRSSANNAVSIANYAISELHTIENTVLNSPAIQRLIQNNKNINLWWLILNSSLIRDVIEAIITIVKRVREKMEEIRKMANDGNTTPATNNPTTEGNS